MEFKFYFRGYRMCRLNTKYNVLEKIQETSFKENNIMKRNNIEEWIRKDPSILGEDLMIIAHEKTYLMEC